MTAEAAAREVATPAGPIVRGQRWGHGASVAILVHAPGEDLDAWCDLPAHLVGEGLAVVAFDLPGHGLSDDPWEPGLLASSVQAVVDVARATGAARVFLVAAEASIWAALRVGTAGGAKAVVGLSPPDAPDDRQASDARAAGLPKLLLVGARDQGSLAAAQRALRRCAGWTVLSTVPTRHQGTRLLSGSWGGQVREQIAAFLRDHQILGDGPNSPTSHDREANAGEAETAFRPL